MSQFKCDILRGAIQKKSHKLWKKSIIFLTPPPRIMWTILNLGKKWYLMTPPPLGPKLGKIWNVDYFDIVAPPLTLTKTVPKSHQTDTWGLFHSYIGHICTKQDLSQKCSCSAWKDLWLQNKISVPPSPRYRVKSNVCDLGGGLFHSLRYAYTSNLSLLLGLEHFKR